MIFRPSVPRHNFVEWCDCKRNRQKKRVDKHVTSLLRIRKEAKYCPMGKVVSHSSFLTFTTHGTPTQLLQLLWSKHKAWFWKSLTHSVVLLFISETFPQTVLQESSDTITRSCLKDHQKSPRTHRNPSKFPCIGWPIA